MEKTYSRHSFIYILVCLKKDSILKYVLEEGQKRHEDRKDRRKEENCKVFE